MSQREDIEVARQMLIALIAHYMDETTAKPLGSETRDATALVRMVEALIDAKARRYPMLGGEA